MIDTSTVNMLELANRYTSLKKTSAYQGGQHQGACPACGGNDRFHVFEGTNSFWCRSCGAAGDPLTFIGWVENLDLKKRDDLIQACSLIGINLDNQQQPTTPRAPRRVDQPPVNLTEQHDYLCNHPHWQERANSFLRYAMDQIAACPPARAYITQTRGISEAVANAALLGWNPKDLWDTWAGVRVWLPRGIVIPWMIRNQIARIRFRRLDDTFNALNQVNGRDMKYPQVKGSSNSLYFGGRSDVITAYNILILTEGEFDALSVHSGAPYLLEHGIKAVATGGTQNARTLKWIVAIHQARRVYLAFDDDKAGADASLWWAAAINDPDKVFRLKPTAHDINDMLLSKRNFAHWLGFEKSHPVQQPLFSNQMKKSNPYEVP